MGVEPQNTIESAFKRFVSAPRVMVLILLAVWLCSGLRFSLAPAEKRPSGQPEAPANTPVEGGRAENEPSALPMPESKQGASPLARVEFLLRRGIGRTNGAWARHPVLSGIVYFFVHEGVVTIVIALVFLGKRREPSREQMTAAYWLGLAAGGIAWTLFWGYEQYLWYILVFVSNTFFMTVVVSRTTTGSAMIARVRRKREAPRRPTAPAIREVTSGASTKAALLGEVETKGSQRFVVRSLANFGVAPVPSDDQKARAARTDQERFKKGAPEVGRNAPCPCGSGKMYKHCHGGASAAKRPATGPQSENLGGIGVSGKRSSGVDETETLFKQPIGGKRTEDLDKTLIKPSTRDTKRPTRGQPIPCPRCGKPGTPGAQFCLHCGEPLVPKPQTQPAAGPKPVGPSICRCGLRNPPDNKFCSHCGKPLSTAVAPTCVRCRKIVPTGAAFCVHCGEKLRDTPSP